MSVILQTRLCGNPTSYSGACNKCPANPQRWTPLPTTQLCQADQTSSLCKRAGQTRKCWEPVRHLQESLGRFRLQAQTLKKSPKILTSSLCKRAGQTRKCWEPVRHLQESLGRFSLQSPKSPEKVTEKILFGDFFRTFWRRGAGGPADSLRTLSGGLRQVGTKDSCKWLTGFSWGGA